MTEILFEVSSAENCSRDVLVGDATISGHERFVETASTIAEFINKMVKTVAFIDSLKSSRYQ